MSPASRPRRSATRKARSPSCESCGPTFLSVKRLQEDKLVIQVSNDPSAFHSFEQKGWNEASDDYEKAIGPLTAQSADAILDAAGVTADCTVLDVCTGHGVLAYAATQRGAKVCALDFAENMIAAARRNAPAADCRQGDAQNLAYGNNSFDAVVCGYGIIHLPQPDRALAEMCRVLRPG